MDNVVGAFLVIVAAMATYAVFSYLRRKTQDPDRERAQLAETDRRITQIEKEAGIGGEQRSGGDAL